MEQFIAVEIFWKKVIPFEVLPFTPLYRDDRHFLYHLSGLPVPGFMSRESEKFTGILQMVQLNPVLVFSAKKIPDWVPFDGHFSPKFPYSGVFPFYTFIFQFTLSKSSVVKQKGIGFNRGFKGFFPVYAFIFEITLSKISAGRKPRKLRLVFATDRTLQPTAN